jgi:hypothetical protein
MSTYGMGYNILKKAVKASNQIKYEIFSSSIGLKNLNYGYNYTKKAKNVFKIIFDSIFR